MEARDRVAGSMLGLALGDALGAPFESRRRHRIPAPLPAFELSWRGRPPGTWTDATAMARNLWRSLIAHEGRLDVGDVLERHLRWLDSDPLEVEGLTRRVLTRVREGATDAAREYVDLRGPEVSAGNGSVMSCAPLGVVRALEPERLFAEAPALSGITHWDGRCRTSCLAVTLAVAAIVRGEPGDDAVEASIGAVQELEGGEELEYLVREAGRARPVDGPDMGFTFFTAGLALRVCAERPGFEDGSRLVVLLGGDTAANAAVTGALLGAAVGRAGLPEPWLERLADRAAIEAEAEQLAALVVER